MPVEISPYAVTTAASPAQHEPKKHECSSEPCIYVANQATAYGGGGITIYSEKANGNAAPVDTISGRHTRLDEPSGVGLDGTADVYVTNLGTNDVTVYASGSYGNIAPTRTISSPPRGDKMQEPSDVAFDAAGNIYVSGLISKSISVYAPGASGYTTPIQYIKGKKTGLDLPSSLAVTAKGMIYVANYSGNSVTVYAAGSTGNVAPIRTISGAETHLKSCTGLALDSTGGIYISNAGPKHGKPSVTVYAKGANGNAVPIRTISGADTALTGPNGIALDSRDNIYVTNVTSLSGGGTVNVYAKSANGNVAPIRTISGSNTSLDVPAGISVR
jgi:hypothetical protein